MKSKCKKIIKSIIKIVIILGFMCVGAALGSVYGMIRSLPEISEMDLKPSTKYTSFVYNQEEVEIDRLSGGEDRVYVQLKDIPLHLQQAVIVTEDERFYEHNGIDIKGIFRALAANIKSGSFSQGASTITQQLIKNNILTSEKTIIRKIQEQYLAIKYEKMYTDSYGEKEGKDLILEYYLNSMPLGRGNNGVQAASHQYFDKDVVELTLAESVVLAGITQAPTRYDPVKNPENNYEKSQIILNKMAEQGYITEDQKIKALEENPYKRIYEVHDRRSQNTTHSYFVDALIDEVIRDLQVEKGMTEEEASKLLYEGGIQIYSTFDSQMQNVVDQYTSDDSLYPQKDYQIKLAYTVSVRKSDGKLAHLYGEGIVKNEDEIQTFKSKKKKEWGLTVQDVIEGESLLRIPQPQSAFVIMDHTTGHIKALSGGRGKKTGDRTFNRVTQAKRQPGSIFKVLSTYAPALEEGIASPGTMIMDEQITYNLPSGDYSPKNWDKKYRGPVTVREAIWHSINTVAVKTLKEVGVDTSYNYLSQFGFTTLLPSDKVLASALGGLTEGVTPIELNAAMATFANGGEYVEPILYTKIIDRDGNVVLEKTPERRRVVSEATAYMMTDMMMDVVQIGTGRSLKKNWDGMPIAGKTGTTNDDKDLLFAGYTPYYTATIWLGHDDPKRMNATGREHLGIWAKIMNTIHEDLPYKDFEKVTTGYTTATLCGLSGELATELCRLDPNNAVATDYYLKSEVANDYCQWHVERLICTVSGKIATEFCPPEVVKRKSGMRPPEGGDKPEALCNVHTEVAPPEVVPPEVIPPEVVPPEVVPPEVVPPDVIPPELIPPEVLPQ